MWLCPAHLLHVAQHVLPAVEHAFALLGVELVDEVGGVVLAAVLIPATHEPRVVLPRQPCHPPSYHCGGIMSETTERILETDNQANLDL